MKCEVPKSVKGYASVRTSYYDLNVNVVFFFFFFEFHFVFSIFISVVGNK